MSENAPIISRLTAEQREIIRQIAVKHGAREVCIFGSVARGEAGVSSDLDLLVQKAANTSPWFPAGLILKLKALLGCKVDVVTENRLSPYLREKILQEAVFPFE
jgi:uncharacterized protein